MSQYVSLLSPHSTETSDAKKHALMRPMELFYAKLKPALKRTLEHNKAAAKAAGGVVSRRDMSLSRKDWPRAVLKHVFLSLQASRYARDHTHLQAIVCVFSRVIFS